MSRALAAAITLASTAALITGAIATAAQASQHGAGQHGVGQHGVGQHGVGQHGVGQHGVSPARSARREHFRIISTSVTSRRRSVLATGAFTAGGYQIPGRVIRLRATDKMVFPGGTFLVARRITRQWLPLPTSACLVRETIHGTYSLGRGTGSYKGISGSGAFGLRIRGVIRRSHRRCGGPMTGYQQITYESGRIRG